MPLLIIAGLIVENINFQNHEAIGEILVWAGVISTALVLLIWLLMAAGVFASSRRI
jgi:hypothetical protein